MVSSGIDHKKSSHIKRLYRSMGKSTTFASVVNLRKFDKSAHIEMRLF